MPGQQTSDSPEVSVVMPCLNEADTLEICITKVLRIFEEHDIAGEVVIADNGSYDGSQKIAERLGVNLMDQPSIIWPSVSAVLRVTIQSEMAY